ncbi:MAG TPA: replication-relaxation family protein [Thermoanaerobaculia bacterium]
MRNDSHLEATNGALRLSPTPPPPRKPLRRQTRRQVSTLSTADRAVLLALARCRLLSFVQVRRAVFPRLSSQRVGQRLHALADAGWITTWEDVSRIGGRPKYALPTRRALTVAHTLLAAGALPTAAAQTASLLLRSAPRRPLVLAQRSTPGFLAHQRECNDLLLAFATIPGVRLLWATSSDRPLPLRAGGIALPQPDAVLVIERAGVASLVFGEHDRGHESLAHFRRTKAERYAALAARPASVRELFGFDHFMVWVTVLDARAGAPLRRLASLVEVARHAAASDVMAFTLAGWAVSSPAAPIWFCKGTAPDTRGLAAAKASPLLRAVPTHPLHQVDRMSARFDLRTACATPPPTCGADEVHVVH